MDHVYRDHQGNTWPAVLDGKTLVKRGRTAAASFAIFCPMPAYRQGVKLVSGRSKLKAHTACVAGDE